MTDTPIAMCRLVDGVWCPVQPDCYRHPGTPSDFLQMKDAMGTPIPLCRLCLTAVSTWLNDAHVVAPIGEGQ